MGKARRGNDNYIQKRRRQRKLGKLANIFILTKRGKKGASLMMYFFFDCRMSVVRIYLYLIIRNPFSCPMTSSKKFISWIRL